MGIDSLNYNVDLFKNFVSNDNLNKIIRTTKCLKTLNVLLDIKQERILNGNDTKVSFPLENIYQQDINNIDVDLQCTVLNKSFFIIEDCDSSLLKCLEFFVQELGNSHCDQKLLSNLKLFNTIIAFCRVHKKLVINNMQKNALNNLIIKFLKSSSSVYNFIIVHFLKNYIQVLDETGKNHFLNLLFEYMKTSSKLDALCTLFQYFFSSNLNAKVNLLQSDDFWIFLAEFINSKDNYFQKQAIYVLSKCIDLIQEIENRDSLPSYINCPFTTDLFKRIWKNYIILIEVSNEKQLHLIEPSLKLLSSIKELHQVWRINLYKKFLSHSQQSVVYFIVIYILKNEKHWPFFIEVGGDLLSALNKNEYSTESNDAFKELSNFCNELDDDKIDGVLKMSLRISWNPGAVWCFCRSLFNQDSNCKISLQTLESLLNVLKNLPNIFIRKACMTLALNRFIKYFIPNSFEALEKMLSVIFIFDESVFEKYILLNSDTLRFYENEIKHYFQISYGNDNENINRIRILLILMMHFERIEKCSVIADHYSTATDLIYWFSFNKFQATEIEIYLKNRLKNIRSKEDITYVLLLLEKICSTEIIDIAVHILIDNEEEYETTQKILAFSVLKNNFVQDVSTFELCKKYIVSGRNVNEVLSKHCTEILLKCCVKDENLEEIITVLEYILDNQSGAVIQIFENFSTIIKYAEQKLVLRFVCKCFKEFFILNKNHSFKSTSEMFLSQIFHSSNLRNVEIQNTIFAFTTDLLNITNNYTTIVLCLSKQIANLAKKDAQSCMIFLPIICKLIFHGINVQKNERVEYLIYQDIYRKFGSTIEENHNIADVSIRLCALEAMLALIKHRTIENVADRFASILVGEYMKYFNKRYFPDSQIYFQKLRIIQGLLLINPFIRNKTDLIELISESFLLESHQTTIKHLMQWLLILLLKNDDNSIQFISSKLKLANKSRPSSVTAFIPVLYHLTLYKNEEIWDEVVETLLPTTMGPQFKLRVFSQVALEKLYRAAMTNRFLNFTNKHKFLYDSVKFVIESSENIREFENIDREFLEYFPVSKCNPSTIYYVIPKANGTAPMEWENLQIASENLENVIFSHVHIDLNADKNTDIPLNQTENIEHSENIQKKIVPWKNLLNDDDSFNNKNDFMLVTSLIEKPTNLGGLARTSEVFGVKQIVMKTSKITSDKEFKSLSMSSENWLNIAEVKVEDLRNFIVEIKRKGYSVIGAEQTSESVQLNQFKFPKLSVLLLGNEKEGISPELIPLLDYCVEIPQFGVVRSLNVHVAGAIIIWEYCKQHNMLSHCI